mgnify:CR=1 FL=1
MGFSLGLVCWDVAVRVFWVFLFWWLWAVFCYGTLNVKGSGNIGA